jgi:hypothetical protein
MHLKTRDLLAHSWQSQANLSFFLFLLVVLGFVLPAMGFEKSHLLIYSDIAFTVASVVGAAIAWENRTLFVLASLVSLVAIMVRWAALWTRTNPVMLWRASTGLAAILTITVVLLWQVFRSGPITAMRVQGAACCLSVSWFRLGTRLPHRSIIGSRCFRRCGERCFERDQLGFLRESGPTWRIGLPAFNVF